MFVRRNKNGEIIISTTENLLFSKKPNVFKFTQSYSNQVSFSMI